MSRRIISLLLGLLLITATCACTAKTEPPNTAEQPDIAELLSLGEQYLTDLDYEQALVQFLKIIELEPRNVRAYLGAAEAYVALGQTEEAVAILEQGLQETDNTEIAAKLEELREAQSRPYPQSSYYESLSDAQRELLSRLEQAERAQDHETAFSIQGSQEFAELVREIAEHEGGQRMVYYPDHETVVYVWAGETDGNHMDLYIGRGGEGRHIGSRYGDGWDNFLMREASYTGGKANGPFSYQLFDFNDPDRGFYTMTGNLKDGVSYGDVYFRDQDGRESVGTWEGNYTISDWRGYQ